MHQIEKKITKNDQTTQMPAKKCELTYLVKGINSNGLNVMITRKKIQGPEQ